MSEKQKATLILEDGTRFQGFSFGAPRPTTGEVVFNTAMTGYPESLTDPSYSGQILVLTFPLVGNYGIPSEAATENGLPLFFESDRIHVRAVIISDYSFDYSHWNAVKSLDAWLKEHNIPGIYGVDTRAITKLIRERGVMLGKVAVGNDEPAAFEDPNVENLVAQVSTSEPISYGNGPHKVILVDCGCKYNIIRCLVNRGATVVRVPWDYDFTTLDYDGVMISNGPGDPQHCKTTVSNIRKAMALKKPIFGICMGNQLLSMAAGGTTYKLKYGHRSHNQPVLEAGTNRALITSQNHGYAVDDSSLEAGWRPWFTNLNDGTNEGIIHESLPFCSVQFHPEASSGPVDTEYLFDNFIECIDKWKKGQ